MKKIHIRKTFREALALYRKNWYYILAIIALIAFVGFIPLMFGGTSYDEYTGELISNYSPLLSFISWLATTYLGVGFLRYLLDLIDGKEVSMKDIFYGVDSIEHFAFVILSSILVSILVFAGLIVFIIPAIIIGLGLMFTKFYMAENRGDAVEAIKASWAMTKGYKWKLLLLVLVIAFFNILGFIALGLGLLVTIPTSTIILLMVYRKLSPIVDILEEKEEGEKTEA